MTRLSDTIEAERDLPDLTPMIDCIFLLLLFFVLTMTFAEETFFPLEIPKARQPVIRTMKDAVVLEIDPRGEFAINRQFVRSRQAVFENLKRMQQNETLKTLVIKADKTTPYEHVIWAIDVVQALKVAEFSFAVKEN